MKEPESVSSEWIGYVDRKYVSPIFYTEVLFIICRYFCYRRIWSYRSLNRVMNISVKTYLLYSIKIQVN